jgi:hypothetical protein
MREVQISVRAGREGRTIGEGGRQIVFGRLVFLLGEYSQYCKLPSEYLKILDFFDTERVFRDFNGCIGEIKSCLFKVKFI